jgi:hypothetical protein
VKKYEVRVYENRTEWYYEGKLDRDDGPAIEYANGNKYWYKNGKYHRDDGPAFEGANWIKKWYLNGKEVTENEVMGKHTLVIDGKTIALSNETFNNLKEFFE